VNGAVTPPHRTDRGPALARAREGRPNHEEADNTLGGHPCGFYKLMRPAGEGIEKIEHRRASLDRMLAQMLETGLVFLYIGGDRSVLSRLVDHQSI
jgi:hypothetical protein